VCFLWPQAEAFHHSGPESLDYYVCFLKKLEALLPASAAPDIDADSPSPPVDYRIVPAIAGHFLNAEHFGTHVGK